MNILITGACAPISADLAKVLALGGHKVLLADSGRWPIGRFSPYSSGYVRLPAPARDFSAYSNSILELLSAESIDCILPTSEEVFWLAQDPGIASKLFAPPMTMLERLHNKATFAELARDLGAGPSYIKVLRSPRDVEEIDDEEFEKGLVAKPIYSRFGLNVLKKPSRQDLKSLDYSRDWVVQSFVEGDEVCLYTIAREGALQLIQAYRPAYRAGEGAGIYFEPVQDPRLIDFATKVIGTHQLHGQISFDVMLSASGVIALECNPRGTSGVHLAAQHPLQLEQALFGAVQPHGQLADGPRPRCLAIPFLLYNGLALVTSQKARIAWLHAKDATREAGIPLIGGAISTLELSMRALRSGVGMEAASTLEFEWNGPNRALAID